jgi:hypothetical protein
MSRFGQAGLLASVFMVFGLSSGAFAQQEMNLRAEGLRPYSAELKPLPTAISTVGNGSGSFGVGAEALVSDKLAFFVDASYVDLDTPNNLVDKEKEANEDPVPNTMFGYMVQPGLRWYGSPAVSSWYGQLGVGYAESKGKYEYGNATIDSKSISTLPTLAAGYRWLFRNNMLLRLGAGASANLVQTHDESAVENTSDAARGEDKVSDLVKTPVLAAVDFGLGYAF